MKELKEYKIRSYSPSEAQRIQKAFFALGGYWINSGSDAQKIQNLNSLAFFIKPKGSITKTDLEDTFENARHKEITLSELEEIAGIQNHEIFQIL